MEISLKQVSVDLNASGSYNGSHKTFGTLQTVFNEPSMSYRSGKIVDITLIVSGSSNTMDLDLLFFPQSVTVQSDQNASLSMSFSDLKNCTGRIRVDDADFAQIGNSLMANLYNVNMTFKSNKLYVLGVIQAGNISLPSTDSVHLNLGCEFGQSNPIL